MLDKNLIELYKNNLKFKELCIDMLSRQYALTCKQVNTYKNILNCTESYLVRNKNMVWDIQTIDNTKDIIGWAGLYNVKGIELNLSFFSTFEKYINFKSIYLNKQIDWSNQLLDTYADKWDWDRLMMLPIVANPRNIEKYRKRYNWDKFSSNRYLKLTDEVLDTYLEKWNWIKLCQNSNFKVEKIRIEKYKDKLCFTALSRNEAMIPFILAHPNDYDWNWFAFIQNPGVVFSDKLILFLISKIKQSNPFFKNAPVKMQDNIVMSRILLAASNNMNFNREIWFTASFNSYIPWKDIIKNRVEILTSDELETHLDLDDFDKVLSHSIIQKLSKEYIFNNKEALLKFRWTLFRNGYIDEAFINSNSIETDWFQIAFNEQLNWSLDFLIKHLDKFESNYGLSQNKTLYESLFGKATNEDIENLLKAY